MDLRAAQRPLKDAYRKDPLRSKITLTAKATEDGSPISCSVDIGRAIYEAQAHSGVGGQGTAACSGDLPRLSPPDAHELRALSPPAYFLRMMADSVSRRSCSASSSARMLALSSRIICFAFASTSSRSRSVKTRGWPCAWVPCARRGCAVERYACRTSLNSLCRVVMWEFWWPHEAVRRHAGAENDTAG